MTDRTSMEYWFPRIEAAGLPVPKTTFVTMTDEMQHELYDLVAEGREPKGISDPFIAELGAASEAMGYPVFLRTTHTSGKHGWETNCYLTAPVHLKRNVCSLIEFSEIVDMMGLPWKIWAVREFLPIDPVGVCVRYGNMPINREFRFFVDEGKVRCFHPYWPAVPLLDGHAVFTVRRFSYAEFCYLDEADLTTLTSLAERAGAACGGSWSIDFLWTEAGWYLTDMAEAEKSFHWEGCETAESQE